MSEHMSDPSSVSSEPQVANGRPGPNAGPDLAESGAEPPRPAPRRGVAWLLLAAVVGFGGGIGGYAVANEVWQEDRSASFIAAAPTNDNAGENVAPVAKGDAMTPGQIYASVSPSVVHITTRVSVTEDSFFGPQEREGIGSGSGFVIDEEGHIVTNAHVVQNAKTVSVSFGNEQRFEAEVVGEDASTDIAVIKVDPTDKGMKDALRATSFGDSSSVRVGDPVVAIGNPFNLDRTLTTGVVSALQRRIPALDDFTISNVIQTDAAINPGNSGGPLLNMRGQVIGVNSQIQSRGGDFAGIAFAVPSSTVTRVAEQLIEDGRAQHAWLGVIGTPLDEGVSELFNLPVKKGVLLAEVTERSPAEKAGLEGGERQVAVDGVTYTLGGDIIVEADGKELTSMRQLIDLVNAKEPGDDMEFVYYRGDDKRSVKVTLGDRPSQDESRTG